MAQSFNYSTGPSPLPAIGTLSYNGCTFSPLVETTVNGTIVKDNAGRTTKCIEYMITADGYVTLPDNLVGLANGVGTVNGNMNTLRTLLTAQAGVLVYTGRGMDIIVNQAAGVANRDVAWGPIPMLLEFQPLGSGRSAKIKWQVKVSITQIAPGGGRLGPVLQFNEDTVVSYDEAAMSQISINGTLEIPLTRITQDNRTVFQTVDQFRQIYIQQIAQSIDLTRFKMTKREFRISRDKRTMEWSIQASELPYMGLPANVMMARGSYDVQPSRTGMGLASWNCQLRVTYTVRRDKPRRVAWDAFLLLLRVRMAASAAGIIPPQQGNQNPGINPVVAGIGGAFNAVVGPNIAALNRDTLQFFQARLFQQNAQADQPQANRRAWLNDFKISEGLYDDSRTVTFSAGWRLVTTFSGILAASGIWKKVQTDGGNTWAASVAAVSGWRGNLDNTLNPAQEFIVDFGA